MISKIIGYILLVLVAVSVIVTTSAALNWDWKTVLIGWAAVVVMIGIMTLGIFLISK